LPASPSFGRVLYKCETYRSKSGGQLNVLLQLSRKAFEGFFGKTGKLRIYRVSGIPKGGVGAREFHRHRSEIITVERGKFRLILENVEGRVTKVDLREGVTYGIIKPFVLHTYVALTSNASLHILANALYEHEKPSTYDSYPESEFRELQDRIGNTA
jgi:oxalate decarboxylase/phosphoglucose isomerase-like protein (cupin superfamily)